VPHLYGERSAKAERRSEEAKARKAELNWMIAERARVERAIEDGGTAKSKGQLPTVFEKSVAADTASNHVADTSPSRDHVAEEVDEGSKDAIRAEVKQSKDVLRVEANQKAEVNSSVGILDAARQQAAKTIAEARQHAEKTIAEAAAIEAQQAKRNKEDQHDREVGAKIMSATKKAQAEADDAEVAKEQEDRAKLATEAREIAEENQRKEEEAKNLKLREKETGSKEEEAEFAIR